MLRKIKIYLSNRLNLPVTYDDNFFQEDWFKNWENLKTVLGELILTQEHWKKIIDFGCGPGIMINHMKGLGVEVQGCDYSKEARELYLDRFQGDPSNYFEKLADMDLTKFDVFMAFDVFEHMTDKEIEVLLAEISCVPELFLNISRAKFIPGHINLKSDEKWISFLNTLGYDFSQAQTKSIRDKYLQLRPAADDLWDRNIFVFKRRTQS